jgi:hypothetical protein
VSIKKYTKKLIIIDQQILQIDSKFVKWQIEQMMQNFNSISDNLII